MLSTVVIIQCCNLGVWNVIKETRASEAQLLCSALTTSLQNELTYARDVEIESNMLKTYFSSSRRMGEGSQILVQSGEIKIKTAKGDESPLVASTNYTSKGRTGVRETGGGYFLQAHLANNGVAWDVTNGVFNVTLWVDDPNNPVSLDDAQANALAYAQFSVKPIVGVQ
jgi:hypothetical protein